MAQVFTPKAATGLPAASVPATGAAEAAQAQAMEGVDAAKHTADSAAVGEKRAATGSPQLKDDAPDSKVSKTDL